MRNVPPDSTGSVACGLALGPATQPINSRMVTPTMGPARLLTNGDPPEVAVDRDVLRGTADRDAGELIRIGRVDANDVAVAGRDPDVCRADGDAARRTG